MLLNLDIVGFVLVAAVYILFVVLVTLGPYLLLFAVLHYIITEASTKRPRVVLPPTATTLTTNQFLLGVVAALLAFLYYAAVDTSRWLVRQWRRHQKRLLLSGGPNRLN